MDMTHINYELGELEIAFQLIPRIVLIDDKQLTIDEVREMDYLDFTKIGSALNVMMELNK